MFGIRLNEEPAYEVLKNEGACELRQYDDLVIATTTVDGTFQQASDEGFRRLAGYIFGHNHSHRNFSMTAPVLQTSESKKLQMTTPVLQQPHKQGSSDGQKQGLSDGWTMSFVLPRSEKFTAAPHPDDDRVKLRPVASQCWAALRYNGKQDEKQMRLMARELTEWISSLRGVRATGEIRWAQYDAPFAIPFLRRNEVQIRVEPIERYQ